MATSSAARRLTNRVLAPLKGMKRAYDNAWTKWENSPRYKKAIEKLKRQGY